LEFIDRSGKFLGHDLLCSVCTNVIATVYREMALDELFKHMTGPRKRRLALVPKKARREENRNGKNIKAIGSAARLS
jgi:hypothetical protein